MRYIDATICPLFLADKTCHRIQFCGEMKLIYCVPDAPHSLLFFFNNSQKPADFNESGKIPHQIFINLSNSPNKCSHLAETFFLKSHFTARRCALARHKRIALETQSSFCAAKDTTFAVYQSCHVTSQQFSPKSGGLTRLGCEWQCSSVYMIEY